MSLRDEETWLIDAGDEVIQKEARGGALSDSDKAVYCLWVLDYAVRNSGTLEPMRDLHPAAKDELLAFARAHGLDRLAAWLEGAVDEAGFCAAYYTHFDAACSELRKLHESA